MHRIVIQTWNGARRAVIGIVGVTVVLLGVVMIVTPGPAVVVIPAGLAILSIEFVWARRLLLRFKGMVARKPAAKADEGTMP